MSSPLKLQKTDNIRESSDGDVPQIFIKYQQHFSNILTLYKETNSNYLERTYAIGEAIEELYKETKQRGDNFKEIFKTKENRPWLKKKLGFRTYEQAQKYRNVYKNRSTANSIFEGKEEYIPLNLMHLGAIISKHAAAGLTELDLSIVDAVVSPNKKDGEEQKQDSGEENICVFCSEPDPNAISIPCGHREACFDCAHKYAISETSKCLLCRREITSIINIETNERISVSQKQVELVDDPILMNNNDNLPECITCGSSQDHLNITFCVKCEEPVHHPSSRPCSEEIEEGVIICGKCQGVADEQKDDQEEEYHLSQSLGVLGVEPVNIPMSDEEDNKIDDFGANGGEENNNEENGNNGAEDQNENEQEDDQQSEQNANLEEENKDQENEEQKEENGDIEMERREDDQQRNDRGNEEQKQEGEEQNEEDEEDDDILMRNNSNNADHNVNPVVADADNNNLANENRRLRELLAQKNVQIQQKDVQIQQKDVQIQQKDVQIQQKDNEIAACKAQINDLTERVTNLTNYIKKADAEINDLRDDLSNQKSRSNSRSISRNISRKRTISPTKVYPLWKKRRTNNQ